MVWASAVGSWGRYCGGLHRLGGIAQLPGQRRQAVPCAGRSCHGGGQRIQPVFKSAAPWFRASDCPLRGLQPLIQGVRPLLGRLDPLRQALGALLDLFCTLQRLGRAASSAEAESGRVSVWLCSWASPLHSGFSSGRPPGRHRRLGYRCQTWPGLCPLGQLGSAIIQGAHPWVSSGADAPSWSTPSFSCAAPSSSVCAPSASCPPGCTGPGPRSGSRCRCGRSGCCLPGVPDFPG